VAGLLWLVALWLVHRQALSLGVFEPFLYLALTGVAVFSARPAQTPERLEVDAAGNVFATLAGRRWRFSPEAIDACYAGWIHIRGCAWSDAPLDALKPDAAPQRLAFTIWRDSMPAQDWQRVRAAIGWLQQRGEPLLGSLAARNTKA